MRKTLCLLIALPLAISAQTPQTPGPTVRAALGIQASPSVKVVTRMVTLEVVVKDSKGRHVSGLKPEDFRLFEQTPNKSKEKREQRIATFREVSVADLPREAGPATSPAAGVYTNAMTPQKDPVPPTIILMDGLNTEVQYQVQVHAQSVKMLAQLPSDVPVAVFLLGFRLEMVQDFTSDPKLLQAAVKKAISTAGHDFAQADPRDATSLQASGNSVVTGPTFGETTSVKFKGAQPDLTGPWQDLFRQLDGFETFVYRGQMDTRVRLTADALEAIAQHMSGYPGRKNLLWISTAFPICIDPAMDVAQEHVYNRRAEVVANALSNAKIAVYPINPAGVRSPTVSTYNASSFAPVVTRAQLVYAMDRQAEGESRELDTMHLMADDTGGEVCTGDNDIADCVRRTVDDSSRYYEIAYYPDSKNWNGEYRRIVLNAKEKGWHLEYRRGYFANADEKRSEPDAREALRHAACEGPLDATSILLTAKRMPPDTPDALKFHLDIGTSALTFTPLENGGSEVNLQLGVCTSDKAGKRGQFMSIPLNRKLSAGDVQKVTKSGIEDIAAIPGPKPASLRLAVMDVPSGRIGSLRIQVDDVSGSAP